MPILVPVVYSHFRSYFSFQIKISIYQGRNGYSTLGYPISKMEFQEMESLNVFRNPLKNIIKNNVQKKAMIRISNHFGNS